MPHFSDLYWKIIRHISAAPAGDLLHQFDSDSTGTKSEFPPPRTRTRTRWFSFSEQLREKRLRFPAVAAAAVELRRLWGSSLVLLCMREPDRCSLGPV